MPLQIIYIVQIVCLWVLQNIVALLALVLSFFGYYLNYLSGSKIEMSVGDKIGLIKSVGSGPQKVHLNCNFINNSSRNGVIDKLILEIKAPNQNSYLLDWDEFYQYVGNEGVKAEALSFPIAVNAKNSEFKGIQFKMVLHSKVQDTHNVYFDQFDWIKGKYTLTLKGWVNKNNINEKPNTVKKFEMNLTVVEVSDLTSSTPSNKAQVIYIPLEQWKLLPR